MRLSRDNVLLQSRTVIVEGIITTQVSSGYKRQGKQIYNHRKKHTLMTCIVLLFLVVGGLERKPL
jgi:hypothetical protein